MIVVTHTTHNFISLLNRKKSLMDIIRTLFFIFLLSLTVISCKKNQKNHVGKFISNEIVIIFDSIPDNHLLKFTDGKSVSSGNSEISYISQNIIVQEWTPRTRITDTLIIKNINQPLEIIQKFKCVDKISFLFKPGDTIRISYNGLIPNIIGINRKTKPYDFNFEIFVRNKVYKKDVSAICKINNPLWVLTEEPHNFNDKGIKLYQEQKKRLARQELLYEKKILDSIYSISKISEKYFRFYDLKIQYELKLIDLSDNKTVLKNDFIQDSLLNFSYYRDFIEATYYQNQNTDSKIVFDGLQNDKRLSREVRKYLMFRFLIDASESGKSNNIKLEYFKKFKEKYKEDTVLINYLKSTYYSSEEMEKELKLKDINGEIKILDDLLTSYKGNVIYVDFWASWCHPCREEMPFSKHLREYYKQKNVVFIYLAINDKFENWEIAIKEEGLESFQNSYFITNPKNSKLIDELGINSIPRFLLYDKTGKLVNDNAPRPSDTEIKQEINKYLKP